MNLKEIWLSKIQGENIEEEKNTKEKQATNELDFAIRKLNDRVNKIIKKFMNKKDKSIDSNDLITIKNDIENIIEKYNRLIK